MRVRLLGSVELGSPAGRIAGETSRHPASRQRAAGQIVPDGQTLLRRRSGGYQLELVPEQIDLHESRQLAARARAAAGGDGAAGWRHAAGLLRDASERWSGPPLAGISGDWAERVRVGLEHERVALLTERFEAELRLGEHERVLRRDPELRPAAPTPPAATGPGGLRSRPPDDVPPGQSAPASRRDDPAHEATPAAGRRSSGWAELCQLPPDLWHFVGRDQLVKELVAGLEPEPERTAVGVVALSGAPGVGKTALAGPVSRRRRCRKGCRSGRRRCAPGSPIGGCCWSSTTPPPPASCDRCGPATGTGPAA